MKKIILALVIVVMIAAPCFAQEVEPEGIFSIEGTLWRMCWITLTLNPSSSYPLSLIMNCNETIGFHPENGPQYYDLGVVSIAWFIYPPFYYYLAIMQPTIGFGVFTSGGIGGGCHGPGGCYYALGYEIGIMYKIEDNWTPYK